MRTGIGSGSAIGIVLEIALALVLVLVLALALVPWVVAISTASPAHATTGPDSTHAGALGDLPSAAPGGLPDARAQHPRGALGELAPGAFLRVNSDAGTAEGNLLRAAPDTLVLQHIEGEQRLPMGSIAAVDERRSRTGRGARIGGIVGAVLGAGALAITARASDDEGFCESDCGVGSTFPVMIGGALGGGFLGACLGAITGSYFPAWEPRYRRP